MNKGKILVADDDHNVLELIDETLKIKNFTILKINDGCSVIPKAKKEHTDLIIVDVMLPHLSGIQICQKLCESKDTKDIPVIVMSAHTTRQLIMNLNTIGYNNYISKPFDINELVNLVELLFQKSEKRNIH